MHFSDISVSCPPNKLSTWIVKCKSDTSCSHSYLHENSNLSASPELFDHYQHRSPLQDDKGVPSLVRIVSNARFPGFATDFFHSRQLFFGQVNFFLREVRHRGGDKLFRSNKTRAISCARSKTFARCHTFLPRGWKTTLKK